MSRFGDGEDDMPEFVDVPEAVAANSADELAALVAEQRREQHLDQGLPAEIDFRGLLEELDPADSRLRVVAAEGELLSSEETNDLDELLAESMHVSVREAHKRAARRQAVERGDLPPQAREHLRAVIQSWEAPVEWEPVAMVQVFEAQHCSQCQEVHYHYLDLYQTQRSRKAPETRRAVVCCGHVGAEVAILPLQFAVRHRTVPVCGSCHVTAERCPWEDLFQ